MSNFLKNLAWIFLAAILGYIAWKIFQSVAGVATNISQDLALLKRFLPGSSGNNFATGDGNLFDGVTGLLIGNEPDPNAPISGTSGFPDTPGSFFQATGFPESATVAPGAANFLAGTGISGN